MFFKGALTFREYSSTYVIFIVIFFKAIYLIIELESFGTDYAKQPSYYYLLLSIISLFTRLQNTLIMISSFVKWILA